MGNRYKEWNEYHTNGRIKLISNYNELSNLEGKYINMISMGN